MTTYFNTFTDNDFSNNEGTVVGTRDNNNNCIFNPLDKMMEMVDENRKLYERLVQAEKDKVEYLEKLPKEK